MLIGRSRRVLLLTALVLGAIALIPAIVSRSTLRNIAFTVWNRQYLNVPPPSAGPTTVQVHAVRRRQTIEGFGANVRTLVIDGRDVLTPSLRMRALDAVYRQVGLTMGMVDQMLVESRGGWDRSENDNDDPHVVDWTGFQTGAIDALQPKLFDVAAVHGFNNYHLGQRINTRWANPWLAQLRASDYNRYLDEAAEQIAVACLYWRDHVGSVPRLVQLFNEPLSGNHELRGGTTRDLVDLVRRAGDRLKQEGFSDLRFVVPSEETEEASYDSAAAILGDSLARPYVGAIGYHPYPLTSPYANVRRLLHTSGLGHPDSGRIAARQRLRDLAHTYNLPLWMTEVSMGGVDPRSYEDFRGRAIHIHDELTYADASAYLAMTNMWDTAQPLHDSVAPMSDHEGTVVLVNSASNTVEITGIGYAIGHYARWIRRGGVRVEAEAGDPLLQVTAFRDDGRRTLTLVLINNAGSSRTVTVKIDGVRLIGDMTGEQSTPSAYWSPLAPFHTSGVDGFEIDVPATSVTTLAGTFDLSAIPARKQHN